MIQRRNHPASDRISIEDEHIGPVLRKLDTDILKPSSKELITADDAEKYVKELKSVWYSLQIVVDRQMDILFKQEQETGKSDDRLGELRAMREGLLAWEWIFSTANNFTRNASRFMQACEKLVDQMKSIRNMTR